MLASKHLNVVIGVDTHLVNIPPAVGVPMPHPFVGMIMDPEDYKSSGTKVHVNNQKRSNAGTTATLGTKKHIPMGAGFFPSSIPLIAHEGIQFYGSKTVRVDGSYFSVAANNLMTCSCIGSSLGEASLYLPTSNSVPVPAGKPVFVGGAQVPDSKKVEAKMSIAGGLDFLMKRAGELFEKTKCNDVEGCKC